jgi:hypothetical protein
MTTPYLTLGAVARRFDLPLWKVRRLFERHLLPEPARAGNYRVIDVDDLPGVENALREAGYLPDDAMPVAQGSQS